VRLCTVNFGTFSAGTPGGFRSKFLRFLLGGYWYTVRLPKTRSLEIFSPNLKFKIGQPKIINCHVLGDFCFTKTWQNLNLKIGEKLVLIFLDSSENIPKFYYLKGTCCFKNHKNAFQNYIKVSDISQKTEPQAGLPERVSWKKGQIA
jgi:hypothetical protein